MLLRDKKIPRSLVILGFTLLILGGCLAQHNSTDIVETIAINPSNTFTAMPSETFFPITITLPTHTATLIPSVIENGTITFWSNRDGRGTWSMYGFNLQNGNFIRLSEDIFREAVFEIENPNIYHFTGANYEISSDGTYLAFPTNTEGGQRISLIDLTKNEDFQIPDITHYQDSPVWHPKENILAYMARGVWVFDVDTRTGEKISDLECKDIIWDPSSMGIICASPNDYPGDLYNIPFTGAKPRKITTLGSEEITDLQITTDGKFLVFKEGRLDTFGKGNENLFIVNFEDSEDIQIENISAGIVPNGFRIAEYSLNSIGSQIAIIMQSYDPFIAKLIVHDYLSKKVVCQISNQAIINPPSWDKSGDLVMYINKDEIDRSTVNFIDVKSNCQKINEVHIDGAVFNIRLIEN